MEENEQTDIAAKEAALRGVSLSSAELPPGSTLEPGSILQGPIIRLAAAAKRNVY